MEPMAEGAGSVRAWVGEAICAIVLALVGLVFVVGGQGLGLFEDGTPGPGLVPMMMGCGLVALGGFIAVGALQRGEGGPVRLFERDSMAAAAFMLIAVAAFDQAGYILTAFAFLFACFTLIGGEPPLRSAVVAGVATAASWALFVKALGVPLPRGVLPWL